MVVPGDISSEQMNFVADLADKYSFGELRVSHEQNIILADVEKSALYALWRSLKTQKLHSDNRGLLTDIICCPGGDFCSLANAKSIPIAESIQRRFADASRLREIGALSLNISGCSINGCACIQLAIASSLSCDNKYKS